MCASCSHLLHRLHRHLYDFKSLGLDWGVVADHWKGHQLMEGNQTT